MKFHLAKIFQRERYENQDNVCIVYADAVMVMIFYCSGVMNINEFYNMDYITWILCSLSLLIKR